MPVMISDMHQGQKKLPDGSFGLLSEVSQPFLPLSLYPQFMQRYSVSLSIVRAVTGEPHFGHFNDVCLVLTPPITCSMSLSESISGFFLFPWILLLSRDYGM